MILLLIAQVQTGEMTYCIATHQVGARYRTRLVSSDPAELEHVDFWSTSQVDALDKQARYVRAAIELAAERRPLILNSPGLAQQLATAE